MDHMPVSYTHLKIENCKMIFEQAKDVDIVINNAGFGAFGEFTKTELETDIQMIDTNIVAVHVCLLYKSRCV